MNKTAQRLLVMGTVVTVCLLFATVGLYAQNYALSVPSATGLSADGRGSSPTNVRTYTPMLSWTFSDADAGDNQTAYHIRVGTSSGTSNMWDVTQTSATRTRMYGGLPLAANTTYYWAVQVYDRAGQPSAFTEATFSILDIGLRLYDGTSTIKIAVDRYNSVDPVSDANRLRIRKSGTSYCIPLLNTTDFGASKIHIRTAASVTKALAMMVAPQPAIGISVGNLGFSGVSGGTSPAGQTVSVTNAGGGTLSGLTASISYGSGSGWLSASLNTATAPATLTVTANPAALSAGTYTATVAVISAVASNSPQNVLVSFAVAPPPAIGLSSGTLSFSGVSGGTSPAGQTVSVTNTGGGALSGLSAGISYGSGSGWLSASLNTTTAPATLTVTASLGSLAAGTYTATVAVSSAVASNSPQNVGVTLTVKLSPPVLSPDAGTYPSVQVNVRISSPTGGTVIHYTLDGTDPTAASPVYAGAIAISTSRTVKAIATGAGLPDSPVASASYTLVLQQVTLKGTVRYRGQPIYTYPNVEPATMWFRDETNPYQSYEGAITYYDPVTSVYAITNLAPHMMGVQFYVNVAGAGAINAFPGNYDRWQDIDLTGLSGQTLVHDVDLSKHMHMTQPFDNSGMTLYEGYPPLSSPVTVAWDPVLGTDHYTYTVATWDHSSNYTYVSTAVPSTNTTATSASLSLPSSAGGQNYQLELYAYDGAGKVIGNVMIVYKNAQGGFAGFGWDYRFTVP